MTQWDIKPAGYENITAEQAKLSGMFPLPGAPRAAPMDPSRLAAFMNPAAGSASASALKPENAKQAKRLFVHNIPAGATPESIVEWFNLQMNGLNVVSGNDPCLSAQINPNKEYALVEFKTPEDATMALTFDGVLMEDDPNNPDKPGMSIRRPKDYIVPVASSDSDDHMEGVPSSVVKDGPKKLSINHLLPNLTEEQLKEVLEVFGELKAFVLVQDTDMDPNNFQSRVSSKSYMKGAAKLILSGCRFLRIR
jgi:splicing factor U2AF subunit